jgi:hypothetical protein
VWVAEFSVSPMNLFVLKAVSKEALLMPALMNQAMMANAELESQLDELLRGVNDAKKAK